MHQYLQWAKVMLGDPCRAQSKFRFKKFRSQISKESKTISRSLQIAPCMTLERTQICQIGVVHFYYIPSWWAESCQGTCLFCLQKLWRVGFIFLPSILGWVTVYYLFIHFFFKNDMATQLTYSMVTTGGLQNWKPQYVHIPVENSPMRWISTASTWWHIMNHS